MTAGKQLSQENRRFHETQSHHCRNADRSRHRRARPEQLKAMMSENLKGTKHELT